jgi:hypothetical protein
MIFETFQPDKKRKIISSDKLEIGKKAKVSANSDASSYVDHRMYKSNLLGLLNSIKDNNSGLIALSSDQTFGKNQKKPLLSSKRLREVLNPVKNQSDRFHDVISNMHPIFTQIKLESNLLSLFKERSSVLRSCATWVFPNYCFPSLNPLDRKVYTRERSSNDPFDGDFERISFSNLTQPLDSSFFVPSSSSSSTSSSMRKQEEVYFVETRKLFLQWSEAFDHCYLSYTQQSLDYYYVIFHDSIVSSGSDKKSDVKSSLFNTSVYFQNSHNSSQTELVCVVFGIKTSFFDQLKSIEGIQLSVLDFESSGKIAQPLSALGNYNVKKLGKSIMIKGKYSIDLYNYYQHKSLFESLFPEKTMYFGTSYLASVLPIVVSDQQFPHATSKPVTVTVVKSSSPESPTDEGSEGNPIYPHDTGSSYPFKLQFQGIFTKTLLLKLVKNIFQATTTSFSGKSANAVLSFKSLEEIFSNRSHNSSNVSSNENNALEYSNRIDQQLKSLINPMVILTSKVKRQGLEPPKDQRKMTFNVPTYSDEEQAELLPFFQLKLDISTSKLQSLGFTLDQDGKHLTVRLLRELTWKMATADVQKSEFTEIVMEKRDRFTCKDVHEEKMQASQEKEIIITLEPLKPYSKYVENKAL